MGNSKMQIARSSRDTQMNGIILNVSFEWDCFEETPLVSIN